MQFKEIIGQEHIKKQLIQSVKENRIPHAQMFAGPEGNGKLAIALAYGQYINCSNRTETDSCGVCNSCKKFNKNIHPDLHFIYPVVKSDKIKEPISSDYIEKWRELIIDSPYPSYEKWIQKIADENKQGMIYVFEGKELIRKLNQKAYESDYKTVIIWMPELMNIECANKILKIVEEPPAGSVLIMVTENDEQIISTIRSRCQLIRIPKIANNDLESALAVNPAIGNNNPSNIARLARGNYLKALDILKEDEIREFNHANFATLMRLGYARNIIEILKWTDEVARIGRVRQKSFLKYCGEFLRENFIMNLKEPDLIYMNDKEGKFSARFAPFINEKNVIGLFGEFDKAFKDISMNGNAKIIFADMSLKISRLIRP
jgi:DNA polymerase-3 subunit delta'